MPASVGGTAGVDTAPVNRRETLASPLYRVSFSALALCLKRAAGNKQAFISDVPLPQLSGLAGHP